MQIDGAGAVTVDSAKTTKIPARMGVPVISPSCGRAAVCPPGCSCMQGHHREGAHHSPFY